ncbi:MAG: tetratricopeptide repeat protein [bacterium]|nr:tetratricopeptide repeat protein [bacterium]
MTKAAKIIPVIILLAIVGFGCAPQTKVEIIAEPAPVKEPPRAALDHFIKGVIYDQQGEPTRAISEYRNALRFDSTATAIYLSLAEDYLALQLPDDALSQLRSALRIDSLDSRVLEFISDLMVQMDQMDSAAFYLERLVNDNPNDIRYRQNLANLYIRQNRLTEAIAQLEQIRLEHPENWETLGQLSTLYIAQKNYDRALEVTLQLNDFNPNDDRICFTVASLFAQMKKTTEADSFFARAAKINPDDPRYYTNWAYLHLSQSNYSKAVEILKKGTAHHPTAADMWALLGSAYQQSKQDSLALKACDTALELDASQVGPYITIGYIYDNRGDTDRAIEVYDQALTIAPEEPLVLNNYAYLLAQKGVRLNEALGMVEKALQKSPDNASYLDTIGWIYYMMGRYELANKFIAQALALDNKNAAVWDHLGDVYLAQGDKGQARSAWLKALEFDEKNIKIREKLAR